MGKEETHFPHKTFFTQKIFHVERLTARISVRIIGHFRHYYKPSVPTDDARGIPSRLPLSRVRTEPIMSDESSYSENRLDIVHDIEHDIEFEDPRQRLPFASLLLFMGLLLLRPWDHIPALAAVRPMLVMTGVTIGLYLLTRPRVAFFSVRPAKLLLAMAVALCCSIAFSYWPKRSVAFSLDYMKQIVLFILIVNLTTTIDRLKKFVAVMVGCCAFHGAFAIFNYASGDHDDFKGIAKAFFEDPNDLALTLVMMLPMAWWLGSVLRSGLFRLASYGCMIMLIGGVVTTQSRGGLLALLAAVAVMVVSQGRERLGVLLVSLVMAAGFTVVILPSSVFDRYVTIADYQEDASAMSRLAVWKAGLKMFADHPFTGVGVGAYEVAYGQSYLDLEGAGRKWRVAHSSYIQVAAELGIGGLLIWLAILASGFLSLFESRRQLASTPLGEDEQAWPLINAYRSWNSAMLASLVGFLVGAVFLSRGYDLLFMVLLALIAILSRGAAAIASHQPVDGKSSPNASSRRLE